jgi:pentatricopeptide repeat protein
MPIEPDTVIWSALLGACKIHNVEVGRRAAEKLFKIEPSNAGNYVMLSNIYSSLGMWDEVAEVRKQMKEQGVNKAPGCSWIQIKNKMHSFVILAMRNMRKLEIYMLHSGSCILC